MRRAFEETIAEMDAEDRAIRYLATLPDNAAPIAAVKTAESLARQWEFEKEIMLCRGDRRAHRAGSKHTREAHGCVRHHQASQRVGRN
jgi:hypothetical protein